MDYGRQYGLYWKYFPKIIVISDAAALKLTTLYRCIFLKELYTTRGMAPTPESDENTPQDPDTYIVGYTIDPDDDKPQDPDLYLHGGPDVNQEDVEPAVG